MVMLLPPEDHRIRSPLYETARGTEILNENGMVILIEYGMAISIEKAPLVCRLSEAFEIEEADQLVCDFEEYEK
jgi:hypothetical protein